MERVWQIGDRIRILGDRYPIRKGVTGTIVKISETGQVITVQHDVEEDEFSLHNGGIEGGPLVYWYYSKDDQDFELIEDTVMHSDGEIQAYFEGFI